MNTRKVSVSLPIRFFFLPYAMQFLLQQAYESGNYPYPVTT
jgi:hypothetical protein